MRILVTGHTGLLGSDLVPVLAARHDVHGCSLPDHDITDAAAARRAVEEARAELVVHTAAWTAVDECEKDPERLLNTLCGAPAQRSQQLLRQRTDPFCPSSNPKFARAL